MSADGSLQNVVVKLVTGIRGHFAVPSKRAVIRQEGCMFVPRVQAIMAGQKIELRNGDPTLHNVHAWFGGQTLFNRAQSARGTPIVRDTTAWGPLVTFRCDVHGWMRAYVVVTHHPYAATTGPDGSFAIPGVSAGELTLEAWHETLGTQAATATVSGSGTAVVDFTFSVRDD